MPNDVDWNAATTVMQVLAPAKFKWLSGECWSQRKSLHSPQKATRNTIRIHSSISMSALEGNIAKLKRTTISN